ncbi:MAG: GAF domain-containing protein [Dehalococcoidales bacterium]|nr:GAF domain-containing protein [Dehalococcoidales bacterium]
MPQAIGKRPMRYEQVFFEAVKRISSSLSTDEVLKAIVESTARAVNAKGSSLLLLSPDKKQLVHSTTYGLSDWFIKKGPLLAEKSFAQALEGKPMQVLNATEDKNVQYRWHMKKEGIASILAVPVVFENEVIGMMRVYTAEPRQFSEEETGFVEGVASLGALALQKARRHEAVSNDLQQCNIDLSGLKKERQAATKSLQQCNIDLSRLANERQNLFHFLSMAAHDLKAPLSAVQTYFGVLLGGFTDELSTRQTDILERCSTRIAQLLELINDLLDISKIEAGQIVTEMEEVSLKTIVDGPVEMGHTLAERKGLKLKVDIPKKLPHLYVASTRLQNALTQLISNAITYTDPGGSVKLRIVDSPNTVRFEVSDTGIGIPKEELDQVFKEFFRASNVKVKGSGLGLSIVKGIIEAHGGDIWAESPCPETGKGCRFTFTIPKGGKEITKEKS